MKSSGLELRQCDSRADLHANIWPPCKLWRSGSPSGPQSRGHLLLASNSSISALSFLQGEWGPGSDRASGCELTSWTALGTWWVSDGMVCPPQFPAPRNLMWSLPARRTSPAPDCCPQWVAPPLQEALTCLVSLVSRTSPGMGTVPSSLAAPHTVGGRISHNEGRK